MKLFFFFLAHILLFFSCSSYNQYENFQERKDVTELLFQDDMNECDKLVHLQTSRSEGSKRAGEILIDKKRYFMSCMDRKGWIAKVSK
jgi:hypothetical protein